MKCPKCHFENPDDTRFCNNCAALLHPSEEISVSQTKTLQTPIKKLTAGAVFAGKYKIIEELGKGGMGVVYKAEDSKLKRTVALKFLSPELTLNLDARERFVHEAQAASGLDHPNICTIHEIDEEESGQMYIAMAYYKGESLKEKIKHGELELEETLDIAIQVAQGLAKAHERGIVHRDIKFANIMITDEGLVKIVDFGLAKLAGTTRITKVGTTMGTVAYMSPEQVRGEEVDQRTDVWSLGIVLYEMVTGKLPFKGEHEQAVVYSILNEEPEAAKGIAAEGKEELLRKLDNASPNAQNLLMLGQLEAVSGRTSEAKQYLNKALKKGISDPYTIMNLAELYALIGQDERAIETLKQALESDYSDAFFPLILPAFQSIREDPHFRALFNLHRIVKSHTKELDLCNLVDWGIVSARAFE